MPPAPQQQGPVTTADAQRSGRLVVDAGLGDVKRKLFTRKQRQMQARNKKASSAPEN